MSSLNNDKASCDQETSYNLDEICYADKYFIQTKNKIVIYKKTNATFKAQRTLFKTVEVGDSFYIIDKAGDCYKLTIVSNVAMLTFIFGILSQPRFFSINNNLINIEDNFNRIYTMDLDGNLQNITFLA